MRYFKVIIEKFPDGYVAYPVGLTGTVVGQGDSYEEALADAKSALTFHIESFGQDVLKETPALEVYVAEAGVSV